MFGYKMKDYLGQNSDVIALSDHVIGIAVRLGFLKSVSKFSIKIYFLCPN